MLKATVIIVIGLILLCLIASSAVYLQPVKAQYQGNITINADGTISPSSAPIQQSGIIYTLTSDENGTLVVERNDTVVNGQGYTLFGELSLSDVSNVTVKDFRIIGSGGLQTQQIGISLTETSNVVIANNTISGEGSIMAINAEGLYTGIYVDDGSSNILKGNNLESNIDAIYLYNTEHNLIVGNNLTDMSNPWDSYSSALVFDHASNNTVYHNNFINFEGEQVSDLNSVNTWDGGYPIGGNYWSDYQTRYPNATEIEGSGIGNIPYVIDANNTDYYPLLGQVDISKPVPTSTLLYAVSSPTPAVPELSWLAIIPLFLSVLSIAIILRHLKTANLKF